MKNKPEPTGAVTLKVLAAAAARLSFTPQELAEASGTGAKTVATVLGRYDGHLVERVGTRHASSPGRPAVEWAVVPEARDELLEIVRSVFAELDLSDRPATVVDRERRHDAVTLGLDLVVRGLSDPDRSRDELPGALRSALRAAGFDPSSLVHSNPESHDEVGRVGGLLAALADMLAAESTGVPSKVGVANALAFYWLLSAGDDLPAEAAEQIRSAVSLPVSAGGRSPTDDAMGEGSRVVPGRGTTPHMQPHFATIWESIADVVPDHDAVVQGDRRVSWREYEDRAARLAQAFLDAGLTANSKIGMFMFNCPEYAETQFAALKIRAVPVNVNYRYLDEELVYLLDNSDAEAVVFHSSLGDQFARICSQLAELKLAIQVPDDDGVNGFERYEDVIATHRAASRLTRDSTDVYMLYTGGTTGRPRGVMYEVGAFCEQFLTAMPPLLGLDIAETPAQIPSAVKARVDAGDAVVAMSVPPLVHASGVWFGLMAPHLFGATTVLPSNRGFDADDILRTIEREGVNLLTIVGDAIGRPLLRLLEHLAATDSVPNLSSLNLIISSGATLSADVKRGLLRFIPNILILDELGSTEGMMIAMSMSAKDVEPSTAAFAPQPTTKVFDHQDREVEPGSGVIGLVATSGTVPIGYYKDDERSQRNFRTIDGVRYSFSGDLATIDADGTLQLVGRSSQLINTGGEKVYPKEVEEALNQLPVVADSVVFGVADGLLGERVAAVVSLEASADATATDVLAALRSRLASFKLPRELVIVDHVPRTATGNADYVSAKNLHARA